MSECSALSSLSNSFMEIRQVFTLELDGALASPRRLTLTVMSVMVVGKTID